MVQDCHVELQPGGTSGKKARPSTALKGGRKGLAQAIRLPILRRSYHPAAAAKKLCSVSCVPRWPRKDSRCLSTSFCLQDERKRLL